MNLFAPLAWLANKLFYQATTPAFQGPSTRLPGTLVVPLLDAPIPAAQSVVWCCSVDLAWKHFQAAHGPPRLKNGEELGDRLNDSQSSPADFPRGWLEFAQDDLPPTETPIEGKLLYCRLKAIAKFDLPFIDYEPPLEFQGVPVNSFGIPWEENCKHIKLRHQVMVLFDNDGEFALDLCATSRPFRVVVAQISRPLTLAAGLQRIAQRTGEPWALGSRDVLLVPNMNWDLTHTFPELQGPVVHPVYEWITTVQRIQFRLDRSGCQLVSVALLAAFMKSGSRKYIFNRPFLLALESRATGRPIFAMWVENAELLERRSGA